MKKLILLTSVFASLTSFAQLNVTSNGYVGVVTATPRTKLHVAATSNTLGNLKSTVANNGIVITSNYTSGSDYAPGVVWSSEDNNATIVKSSIFSRFSSTGSYLHFGTSSNYATGVSNDAMIIDPNGNVGLGTTAPRTKIHVAATSNTLANLKSTVANNGIVISSNYTSGADYAPGVVWSSEDNNAAYVKASILSRFSSTGSYLYFGTSNNYTSSGVSNDAMVIDYNGSVGVGTGSSITAQTQFDVNYNTGSAFTSGPVYGSHFVNGNTISGSTNPYVYGAYSLVNGSSSNTNAYHYGFATSTTNGYNCVGLSSVVTSSSGNGKGYGGYFNTTSATSGSGNTYGVYSTIGSTTAGNNNYGVFITNTNTSGINNFGLYSNTAGTASSSLNYGVYSIVGSAGTTNVAIYGAVTATTTGNYAGYFYGDVYTTGGSHSGTGYLVASDQQFKTKIDTIGNPLAILKKLKPKRYFFDTTANNGMHFSGKKQYGFIAQELQQLLPELVYNVKKPADVDSTGNIIHPAISHLAINYDAIIPLLTAAMQTQQNKVDSLTALATNQDSINKALQAQINACCKTGKKTANNSNQDSLIKALQQQINACCSKNGQNNTSPNNTGNGTTGPQLYQNVPNPFNQTSNIKCFVPDASKAASLLIFDMNGSLKKTIVLNGKGEINTIINAKELIAGMYFYTLIIDGSEIDTKKMILTEQ